MCVCVCVYVCVSVCVHACDELSAWIINGCSFLSIVCFSSVLIVSLMRMLVSMVWS